MEQNLIWRMQKYAEALEYYAGEMDNIIRFEWFDDGGGFFAPIFKTHNKPQQEPTAEELLRKKISDIKNALASHREHLKPQYNEGLRKYSAQKIRELEKELVALDAISGGNC